MAARETCNPVQWVTALNTPDAQARIRARSHAQVSALCEELNMVAEW